MLFQKKKIYPQHKELKIIRLDLINYIICLNKKNAEIYNNECSKLGLNILSLEEAFPKLVNLYDFNNKDYENSDDSNNSLNDSKRYYFRERQKKDKKKVNYENKDYDRNLNKKRNNPKKKNNNDNTNIIKPKYNNQIKYIKKNTEEYLDGKIIRKEDLFKMIKSLDNKINRKKDKKYILDKVQMSMEEKKELMNNVRKEFVNLSLSQVMEIQQRFFKDSNNNDNDVINIELHKLTQEELKRLLCYIEDYKKNNSIDPNFINYEEEIKRRNSENKNENMNNIHIFTFENKNNIDMSDSDDSDDDDNLSDENNQKKIDSNVGENNDNLNNEIYDENNDNNFIDEQNEENNNDIFENYSNLVDNE